MRTRRIEPPTDEEDHNAVRRSRSSSVRTELPDHQVNGCPAQSPGGFTGDIELTAVKEDNGEH
jgi:hypothetical protein